MKENIKIKIELFKPFILEKDDIVADINYKFLDMIKDIMQSKIMIDIDGKSYEVMADFQKEKGKGFRYYKTLILKFVVDISELYNRRKFSTKTFR